MQLKNPNYISSSTSQSYSIFQQ